MSNAYRTTRIWSDTLRKLRIVAALRGESIVNVLDQLTNTELARLEKETTMGTQPRELKDEYEVVVRDMMRSIKSDDLKTVASLADRYVQDYDDGWLDDNGIRDKFSFFQTCAQYATERVFGEPRY